MPLKERFGRAPVGACLQALSFGEIADLDLDSSRSYAKCCLSFLPTAP